MICNDISFVFNDNYDDTLIVIQQEWQLQWHINCYNMNHNDILLSMWVIIYCVINKNTMIYCYQYDSPLNFLRANGARVNVCSSWIPKVSDLPFLFFFLTDFQDWPWNILLQSDGPCHLTLPLCLVRSHLLVFCRAATKYSATCAQTVHHATFRYTKFSYVGVTLTESTGIWSLGKC